EQALLVALREFRDLVMEGWPVGCADGERKQPAQAWIDAGYMTPIVYRFSVEAGERFLPAVGRGAAQQRQQWYNRPTQTGSLVKHIGEGFHLNRLRPEKLLLAEIDADHWKTWVHQRLSTPLTSGGAMTLFQASPQEHLALAKHLTAEVKTEEFVAGKGVIVKWERLRRQNHWFDALYNACAAGHYCGVRLVDAAQRPPRPRLSLEELARLSNRPTARELTQ
ncbi:MAG: terminase gpA endonuclease subunit, partial [Planctomycetales bacterium]